MVSLAQVRQAQTQMRTTEAIPLDLGHILAEVLPVLTAYTTVNHHDHYPLPLELRQYLSMSAGAAKRE